MMLVCRIVLIIIIITNVYLSLSHDYDDPVMNIALYTFLMFLHILITVLIFIFIVNKSYDDASQPSVRLLVPFPKYKSDILELCKHHNGQVILDFKWNTFGFKYHIRFLIFYMAFFLSFAIASTFQFNGTSSDDDGVEPLLYATIVFGVFHLFLEIVRVIQSLCMKGKFFLYVDFWFLLDISAYSLPVITSAYWLINNNPPPIWAISLANLLLDLKFMLFLRCFSYFGAYFSIILGVARKVFSFLVILFIIIISFAHAFYILLTPRQQYSLDEPTFNDDSNNPWHLTYKYQFIYTNGDSYTYNHSSFIMQQPDGNTNEFTSFPLSMLAIYNFLAGDKNAFDPWILQDDPYLAILVVLFSFLIVVYLMNLFIGLLSDEIQNHNTEEAFYTQKAKVITSVELLFNKHRHLHPYFITYYAPVEDIRKKIREVDNSEEDPEYLPYISDDLRKLVDMPKPENDLKKIENKFMDQIQLLLNEIKSLESKDPS